MASSRQSKKELLKQYFLFLLILLPSLCSNVGAQTATLQGRTYQALSIHDLTKWARSNVIPFGSDGPTPLNGQAVVTAGQILSRFDKTQRKCKIGENAAGRAVQSVRYSFIKLNDLRLFWPASTQGVLDKLNEQCTNYIKRNPYPDDYTGNTPYVIVLVYGVMRNGEGKSVEECENGYDSDSFPFKTNLGCVHLEVKDVVFQNRVINAAEVREDLLISLITEGAEPLLKYILSR